VILTVDDVRSQVAALVTQHYVRLRAGRFFRRTVGRHRGCWCPNLFVSVFLFDANICDADLPINTPKGIAQGLTLSALLCNMYLGAMERALLSSVYARKDTLLLRHADDTLCITCDRNVAVQVSFVPSFGNFDFFSLHIL
jgi:hypothetical protein